MPRSSSAFATPNPLLQRDPGLIEQLAAFRLVVNDMLLDKLAAARLHEPNFRAEMCPHSLEEVKAVVQVLRVLTRPSWDEDDLDIFDACWREAVRSGLFGDEFEAERHRIQQCVDVGRKALLSREQTAG